MLTSRRNVILACALSAVAGYVDGIGFIHLGGLFVSFMSGNSTRLGVSLAEGNWRGALEALGLIAVFITGAGCGSLIVRRGRYRQASVLFVEALLLVVAAASYQLDWPVIPIVMIVMAMGLENAVFQIEGGAGIGLTYMTGALVKVGQGLASALSGGARWVWLPNLLLWASLVTGAIIGTLAYHRFSLAAIWFAAGAVMAICVILAVAERTQR
jgi:uncharacterized membrane protein YoaK (UPF0700 family)